MCVCARLLEFVCVFDCQIYREKIAADGVDDASGNERQSMAEYVYDWFLNKYGLKKLAEQQLTKVFASCVK